MEIKSFFESVKKWEDIEALISNEIRETDTLEYKVATDPFSESNKKEIAKDVSAFANSSGGVLVYGVECDPRDKTKPIKISGVAEPNIETFDRVVNSQIRPEIKGLGKEIISKGNLKVMIILVPKSEASPHQSLADNKYYRRSLTESRPVEHDLVELHFGRRLGPILDVVMVNTNEKDFSNLTFKEDGFSEPVRLRFMITNSGKRVGKYVEVIFLFPHDSSVRLTGSEGLTNIDTLYSGPPGPPIHREYWRFPSEDAEECCRSHG